METKRENQLNVGLRDDCIAITIPGSSFRTAYQSSLIHIDKDWPLTRDQFEKLAWQAANEEARKLGWIE